MTSISLRDTSTRSNVMAHRCCRISAFSVHFLISHVSQYDAFVTHKIRLCTWKQTESVRFEHTIAGASIRTNGEKEGFHHRYCSWYYALCHCEPCVCLHLHSAVYRAIMSANHVNTVHVLL